MITPYKRSAVQGRATTHYLAAGGSAPSIVEVRGVIVARIPRFGGRWRSLITWGFVMVLACGEPLNLNLLVITALR